MYNYVHGSPHTLQMSGNLQGIQHPPIVGPSDWPEAERAFCCSQEPISNDNDSLFNPLDSIRFFQHFQAADTYQLCLELDNLRLSSGLNIAELSHRLMSHAKEAEMLDKFFRIMMTWNHRNAT